MEKTEAMAALDAVGDAKAALARAAECPPWRHAAFGAVIGLLMLAMGIDPPLAFALEAVALACVAVLIRADRKRMGVFINGYRKGATRPLTLVLVGVIAVIGVAEVHARSRGLAWWTRVVLALVAAGIATAMSVAWQRVFRREMGLGA